MSVVALLGTLMVGGVLAVAGLLKLLRPAPPTGASPATPAGWTGLLGSGRSAALGVLGALEVCIGLGVLAFGAPLPILAAIVLWGFAAWQWLQVARGRSGEPCSCFGARTAIGVRSAGWTLGLALLATALSGASAGSSGASQLSAVDWLGLACGLLVCGVLALGSIAFLLAREVAHLRGQPARSAPSAALEILQEGPPLGRESPLIERFAAAREERPPIESFAPAEEQIALAVFLSPGCAICQEIEPSLDLFAAHNGTELVVFDEHRHQLAWLSASIPGSPYAVAMSHEGVALAKGTFNTLEQLASIPATARLRMKKGLALV